MGRTPRKQGIECCANNPRQTKCVAGSIPSSTEKVNLMNKKPFIPFLLLASLSGCVIANQSGYYGDVTFSWTFAGLQCSSVPQVASVHIRIPGEVLQNDGVFPCSTSGFSGITLRDFSPGTYDSSIDALSYSNTVLYTASSHFTVDGNIQVNIDLAPVGSGSSYAYLMWTFPPNAASQNPNCDQAGDAYVDVTIDQGATLRYSCADGMTAPGAQTPFLNPGPHHIELIGVDSTNYPYYRASGNLTTTSGTPISASYQLGWNVGGVSIAWQLIDGFAETCAQAGVQTVTVNFRDSAGNLVYGPNGDPQPCTGAPILYNAIVQGNYQMLLVGTGPGGTFRSNVQNPPTVTIVAGAFVDGQSTPLTIPMYRQ
jgi:hypothetical protein